MIKKILTSLFAFVVIALVVSPKVSAQDFFQITGSSKCSSKTYTRGQVIPANTFRSLSACNSYIQSFIDFAQNNVFVGQRLESGELATADDADWCGGQAQFPCTTGNAETNGCDTGYVVSEIGSCIARAADDSQYILFRDCQENGGTVQYCEQVAFGGQEYLGSEQASFIQDCMNTIKKYGYNIDPEYCQAAATVDAIDFDSGDRVASCINTLVQIPDGTCGSLNRQEADQLSLIVLNGNNLNSSEVGTYNSRTPSNRAESILALTEYCENSAKIKNNSCRDLAYQLIADNPNFSLDTIDTCLTNPDALVKGSDFFAPCQPILETIEIVTSSVSIRKPETAQTPPTVANPFAVPIKTTAVVYISSENGQTLDHNRNVLRDCTTTANRLGFSQSQCESFMLKFPTVELTGQQIARCIEQPNIEYCPGGQSGVAQQVSITVISIDQQIADCANAGASEVDCRSIIKANIQAPLTGRQVAECIENINADGSCAQLAGIQEVSYSACTTLGACVEGKTCIYQGSKVLRNVGAKCNDRPQVRSCEPIADQFSTNGKEGAPCCGGGNVECGSGICNAGLGLQGECSAATSSTIASSQTSELAVGISAEDQQDCSLATGLVQGTEESGFTLKCDFDGNGSYGYHQPTGFVRGNEAIGTCQILCADPTADVENAARTQYQSGQIAAARIQASKTSNPDFGTKPGVTICEEGTFESKLACVNWHNGVCIKAETGCYRQAVKDEIPKVCTERFQQTAYDCSFVSRETCLIHPETGCYAPKSEVFAAQQSLALEIKAAQLEVEEISKTMSVSIVQRSVDFVENIGTGIANFFGPIVGAIQNSQQAPDSSPAEETIEKTQAEVTTPQPPEATFQE